MAFLSRLELAFLQERKVFSLFSTTCLSRDTNNVSCLHAQSQNPFSFLEVSLALFSTETCGWCYHGMVFVSEVKPNMLGVG